MSLVMENFHKYLSTSATVQPRQLHHLSLVEKHYERTRNTAEHSYGSDL